MRRWYQLMDTLCFFLIRFDFISRDLIIYSRRVLLINFLFFIFKDKNYWYNDTQVLLLKYFLKELSNVCGSPKNRAASATLRISFFASGVLEHSLVYSTKRAGAIKHGGFGASHEKTRRIFNVRHVGTRLRTHARCGRHTAKNTSAAINSETRGTQRAETGKGTKWAAFLRALNKKSRREI